MKPSPHVVAIIQARMGSSRLTGKVLLDLAGEPMLARVVNRVRRSVTIDEVVIATTTEPAADRLAELCARRGWPCFRGSQDDVLDRYHRAAREHRAEVVVRITSDCPLIDPEVLDRVVGALESDGPPADYACNFAPRRTFPRGLDVEAMTRKTLDRLWTEDRNPAWREYVTQYLHHNLDRFVWRGVEHEHDLSALRWTVDTPKDYELIRRIYGAMGRDSFSWRDVLALLASQPEWLRINSQIQQKVVS
jgi:spore coat polysaccharide biosynthesis protein SpsF